MQTHAEKLRILKLQLVGKKYHRALKALNFARRFHTGMRKDGVTPEFDHQVSIALFAMTLPKLIHREAVIAAIMLHDVVEDYDVPLVEIESLFRQRKFALLVRNGVDNVTKKTRGVAKPKEMLYAAMRNDPVASIVKGCDRIHNFQSMVGVFSHAKQVAYIAECEEDIMPMLSFARDEFSEQYKAYENIKHNLLSQIELIRAIHEAAAVPA